MTDLDLAAIRGRVERARESVRGVNLPEREIAWADLRSHAAEDTWRLLGEVDRLSAEQDERIQAWEAIAAHAAFADCYREERPLLESVIDRIDALVSTSEAVVELAPSSLQAEIDRLNATIQRVREIVTDPQTVGWIERDGDTAWIPAERIREALGIPDEPLSKRHPAMSREDLRRAFEGGDS